MSKRTKASKKRLNSLLIILLLTAVLLVMSTYAWFTANRIVSIDTIDVRVATSSGLQISANGIDWKTIIDKTDITNAYQDFDTSTAGINKPINQLPTLMAPVSTALNVNSSGQLDMFYGVISTDMNGTSATNTHYGDYWIKAIKQTEVASETVDPDDTNEYAKGYYIAFDMFLRDDLDAADLYWSGSVVEKEGGSGKQLENAARVALIKGGNTGDAEDVDAVQSLTTVGGTAVLWEPNNDTHSSYAVTEAGKYGITTTEGSGKTQITYDGVADEFDDDGSGAYVYLYDALASNYSTLFTTMDPDWSTPKAGTPSMNFADANTSLADGSGNQLTAGATRYRVYMWVEGQDVDCENHASGTEIEFTLNFGLDAF